MKSKQKIKSLTGTILILSLLLSASMPALAQESTDIPYSTELQADTESELQIDTESESLSDTESESLSDTESESQANTKSTENEELQLTTETRDTAESAKETETSKDQKSAKKGQARTGQTYKQLFQDPLFAEHVAGLLERSADDIVEYTSLITIKEIKLLSASADSRIRSLEGISNLPNVQHIVVYMPNIEGVPSDIGQLESLIYMEIASSQVDNFTVPESIGDLTTLTKLNLSMNKGLKSLPDSIGNLTNLEEFKLYGSGSQRGQLEKLPDTIKNLGKLKDLDVSENSLATLPSDLSGMEKLRVLNLENNLFETLPDSLGDLSALTILKLSKNKISQFNDQLLRLNNLVALELRNNHITELPDSIGGFQKLETLYLSYNQLTSLPSGILDSSVLKQIELNGNLLPSQKSVLNSVMSPITVYDEMCWQGKLMINNGDIDREFTITSKTDLDAIALSELVYNRIPMEIREVLPTLNFVLDELIDEGGNTVDIADYINGSGVIKNGIVSAKIRATGTGLFPNNSHSAITDDRIKLKFAKTDTMHTVSFDVRGNGSLINGQNQTVADGGTLSQIPGMNANAGHHFVKWIDDNDSEISDLTTYIINRSQTIYAVFEPDQPPVADHTVNFAVKGNGSLTNGAAQTVANSAVLNVIPGTVPGSGHHFVKWVDDNDSEISDLTTYIINRSQTIYAVFEPDQTPVADHTVNFAVKGNGSLTNGAAQTVANSAVLNVIPGTVPGSGHHFVKWVDDTDNHISDLTTYTINRSQTIYAVFEPDQPPVTDHTVSFAVKGSGSLINGTAQTVANSAVLHVIPDTAPDSGHHFVKWVDDADNEITDLRSYVITRTQTIYAVFAADQTPDADHKVSFDVIGEGRLENEETQTIADGAHLSVIPAPVAESGNTFTKWIDDNGNEIADLAAYTITRSQTLYAVFNPDEPQREEHIVTFKVRGKGSLKNGKPQTIADKEFLAVIPTPVPDKNHLFVKWFDEDKKEIKDLKAYAITKSQTIYAQFEAKKTNYTNPDPKRPGKYTTKTTVRKAAPKTGDNQPIILWIIILLAAAVVIIYFIIRRRKK